VELAPASLRTAGMSIRRALQARRPIRIAVTLAVAGAFFASLGVAAPPEAPVHLTPGAPAPSADLVASLAAKDRELFEAAFDCHLDRLPGLIAEDFEFLHDKAGKTAGSAKEFLDSAAAMCARRAAGTDFKARRELADGSMKVFVLSGYGAMQTGTHRFYALREGQPDQLTETGQFIHVWRQIDGAWKLARVISYDHQLADSAK
jgi:hypothetical protein